MAQDGFKKKLATSFRAGFEKYDLALKLPYRIVKKAYKSYQQRDKLLYQYGFLSSEKLFLPDFLVIGVEKAGTTWLYENLRKHPNVFVTHIKELNYFDRDFDTKRLKFYSDYFKNGLNKMKGEATPGYAYLSDHRIRFIRAIMPDMRLILMIRNPIEQQWSIAFQQLVRKHGFKIKDVPESMFFDFLKSKKNRPYWKGGYSGILDRWLSHFPGEQLFIGFFEDISKQPKALLSDVFTHIGVSCDIDWNLLPYNEIIVPPAGPKYRNYNPYRGAIDPQHQFSVSSMDKKYHDFLKDLNIADIAEMQKRFKKRVADWNL